MITYLIVLGKTSFAIMLFYLFYRYILAKDKLFMRNRIYLLSSSILAFVLPWIHIPIISVTSDQTLSYAYINNTNSSSGLVKPEYQSISWMQIILLIYIAGAVLFLLKSLISYFQVFKLIKKAFYISTGRFKIVTTARKVSPFSFFNWIVIPEKIQQHPSFDKMVQHEIVHCRQYHSVDLFICELLIILQWFNPFAWLIRRAVSENLEYLVDEEMLTQGTDARDYQYSLLSFSMGGSNPAVANNFNTHLLKKRIIMMNTNKYSRNHRLHNLLIPVCLVFALLLTASFRKEINKTTVEKPINSVRAENSTQVEKPSGTIKPKASIHKNESVTSSEIAGEEYVLGFIAQNIIYPKSAISMNLEATVEVIVKFKSNGVVIQEKNSASDAKFREVVVIGYGMESSNTLSTSKAEENNILVEEVKRVAKSLSNIPEELIGKTVTIPVKFMIQKPEQKNEELKENIKSSVKENVNENVFEPVYILNDEKIISKKEMETIDTNTIQSVEVRKSPTVHSKFGELKGGAVIINLKK